MVGLHEHFKKASLNICYCVLKMNVRKYRIKIKDLNIMMADGDFHVH